MSTTSSGVSPNRILPRHFIVRAGVSSPLTARYTKHAVAQTAPETPRAKRPAAATPNVEQLRHQLQENEAFISQLLYRLRDFPDAADAISEMIKPTGSPNADPDFAYD